jgi:hypothetical protein
MNHSDLIEALGGVTAVSRILNIKPPSVSAWKKTGIPDDKLIRLAPIAEQKGVATRRELFPNDCHSIWPELVSPEQVHPTEQEGEVNHVS